MSASSDRPFGRASIGEIRKFRKRGDVAALADLLTEPEVTESEQLQYEIARALYMMRDHSAAPALLKLAGSDVHPKPRMLALAGLADLGDREAIPSFISALSAADVNTRLHAVRGLTNSGSNAAVRPLISVLEDRSGAVRVAAARGLAALGDAAAIEAVAKATRATTRPLLRLRLRRALMNLRAGSR